MPLQSESVQTQRSGAALALLGWAALCFVVGAISFLFSRQDTSPWYQNLTKPHLMPPNGVFAPVWIALYTLMAIAVWLVWRTRPSPCRRTGLRLFGVQLWFNLLWAWIFFSRHQIATALADLLILWIAILMIIVNFRKVSTTAAWLMLPYLAWVTFAIYLNFGLWRLN